MATKAQQFRAEEWQNAHRSGPKKHPPRRDTPNSERAGLAESTTDAPSRPSIRKSNGRTTNLQPRAIRTSSPPPKAR
jgi:hypothetical protein